MSSATANALDWLGAIAAVILVFTRPRRNGSGVGAAADLEDPSKLHG
jgi:hypothetical protein